MMEESCTVTDVANEKKLITDFFKSPPKQSNNLFNYFSPKPRKDDNASSRGGNCAVQTSREQPGHARTKTKSKKRKVNASDEGDDTAPSNDVERKERRKTGKKPRKEESSVQQTEEEETNANDSSIIEISYDDFINEQKADATDTSGAVTDTSGAVTDTSGVVINTSAMVTDTSAVVTDTSAVVTDTSAVVTDTSAVVTELSYADFLKTMNTTPSDEVDAVIDENDNVNGVRNVSSTKPKTLNRDNVSRKKEGAAGLFRYFASSKASNPTDAHQRQIVLAEIHSPSSVVGKPQYRSLAANNSNKGKSNVVVETDCCVIESLGQCPITPEKLSKKRPKRLLEELDLETDAIAKSAAGCQRLAARSRESVDGQRKGNNQRKSKGPNRIQPAKTDNSEEADVVVTRIQKSPRKTTKSSVRQNDSDLTLPVTSEAGSLTAKKITQMTFSFGKNGFKMEKSASAVSADTDTDIPEADETSLAVCGDFKSDNNKTRERTDINRVDTTGDKQKQKTRRRLNSNQKQQQQNNEKSPIEKMSRRSVRNSRNDSTSPSNRPVSTSEMAVSPSDRPVSSPSACGMPSITESPRSLKKKRRILRSTYQTTVVKDEDPSSPLRIRITRTGCKKKKNTGKSAADDEIISTKPQPAKSKKAVNNKKTVARQLLQKAKDNKIQKKIRTKSSENEQTTALRRSSRTPRQQNPWVEKPVKKPQHKRRDKNSKESSTSSDDVIVVKSVATPKKSKSAMKLAPIFKGKKRTGDKTGHDGKDDDAVIVVKEETEAEKTARIARQKFLLSGIPDQLRQKNRPAPRVTGSEYVPFPKQSHVRQLSSDAESVSKPLVLPLLCERTQPEIILTTGVLQLAMLTQSLRKEKFSRIPRQLGEQRELGIWSKEVEQGLLYEIKASNPAFPIRKMYSSLTSRKLESEKSENVVAIETETDKQQSESAATAAAAAAPAPVKRRAARKRGRRLQSVEEIVVVKNEEDQKKDDDICKINEAGSDVLWTEKYQPKSSLDILGNSNNVKKLKSWLIDWKERVDREAKHLRLMMKKQAKLKRAQQLGEDSSSSWWSDDDDDFDVKDDSDNEQFNIDDGAVNTMCLVGAHGIGKTATVYALAQELGYKVFEVNASSRRNGKHILAQLQEATQSHHLSKHNHKSSVTTGAGRNPFIAAGLKTGPVSHGGNVPPKKPAPASFANFFKTADSGDGKKKSGSADSKFAKKKSVVDGALVIEKESKKKSPMKKNKTSKLSKEKKTHNDKKQAASISLILFDEVDVVFEEDKAFWAAIQTFMESTKRPMIMTTTDRFFPSQFEGRFDTLRFKAPASVNVTSYLQSVCLAERIRTDFNDLKSLVDSQRHTDIRQLILSLQFWTKSGASSRTTEKPLRIPPTKPDDASTGVVVAPLQPSTPKTKLRTEILKKMSENQSDNSDDDFEIVPRSKRRRLVIEESDSSKDGAFSPVKRRPVIGGEQTDVGGDESSTLTSLPAAREVPGPLVHVRCFESVTGFDCCLPKTQPFKQLLLCGSGDEEIFHDQIRVIQFYRHLGIDVVYGNLRNLLELPTFTTQLPYPIDPILTANRKQQITSAKKKFKRIRRPGSDLYDSEASESEDVLSAVEKQTNDEAQESTQTPASESSQQMISEQTGPSRQTDSEPSRHTDLEQSRQTASRDTELSSRNNKRNIRKPGDKIVQRSIDSLSKLYDNFSFSDSYLNYTAAYDGRGVVPGLTDELPIDDFNADIDSEWNTEHFNLIRSTVDMLNLRECRHGLRETRTESDDDYSTVVDDLTLPVDLDSLDVEFTQEFQVSKCNELLINGCQTNVQSSLPLTVSSAAIVTDYLPYLRQICKTEQFRQATKAKRRFFHYLDSIQLHIKQSTIDALTTLFS
ncbi:ATPase family AAA domain-containing protein 5-like isoform X2 [Tubulanus polymorphus]|uniref:ATPase family AAA domain-containing protein 5-like isoform X2 n=1 Tax=Tubulanus polymorphus TaxID=672921 RepID=UPI003DA43EE7